MIGRAEALAAGLGDEAVGAEHLLLALLLHPEREWPFTLAGATRARGVRLLVELPPTRPRPARPELLVYFPEEELRDVLARLPALLPPDTGWAWNVDGGHRAWIRATGEFDLRELVRRARDGAPA